MTKGVVFQIEYPCSLNTASFPYDIQVCNLSMSEFTIVFNILKLVNYSEKKTAVLSGSWNFEISKMVVHSTVQNITPVTDQFDVLPSIFHKI